MSEFLELLHKRNTNKRGPRNINLVVIGESGIGKSYATLRIADLYYMDKLKQKFPVDNVVFTISEFIERVKELGKCSIIIFDDAGLKYSSTKWYEELNQVLGYTLQSYRFKIINVIFTIPVKDWLDRIGRGMLHGQIEMKFVGQGVYTRMTYNSYRKQIYYKRLFLMNFAKPSEDIIKAYETKKRKFLDREYSIYLTQAKKKEGRSIGNDEIIKTILLDPKAYMVKDNFQIGLIQHNFNLAHNRSYSVLMVLRKMREEGQIPAL